MVLPQCPHPKPCGADVAPLSNIDEVLVRRVHRTFIDLRDDGTVRVSSAAFKDSSDGSPMSVGRLDFGDVDSHLDGRRDHSLASFTLGQMKKVAPHLKVCPLAGHRNGHSYVCGKKSHDVRQRLANIVKWEKLVVA